MEKIDTEGFEEPIWDLALGIRIDGRRVDLMEIVKHDSWIAGLKKANDSGLLSRAVEGDAEPDGANGSQEQQPAEAELQESPRSAALLLWLAG
jgi:hypothetical protein